MAEDRKENKGGIPQAYWRYIGTLLFVSAMVFSWSGIFNGNAPSRSALHYSQFMEQLDAGNIRSVSIKKELVTGEFVKEASVRQPGEKKSARVKHFQTVLPSFQGEGLLSELKEKNVKAGHTLAAWELPGADPIYKVSISPLILVLSEAR